MSHYLEMDFLRRGKPIPLHGVKVGLGTLVSLHLYKRVAALAQEFAGKEIAGGARRAAPFARMGGGAARLLRLPDPLFRDRAFRRRPSAPCCCTRTSSATASPSLRYTTGTG